VREDALNRARDLVLESRAGQRKCGKSMPAKSSILPAVTDSLDPARIPAIIKNIEHYRFI
jgi:hypothetical protein